MEKIRGMKIKMDTIYLLLLRTLSTDNNYLKNNSNIKIKLINMLYKYNKNNLINCFK